MNNVAQIYFNETLAGYLSKLENVYKFEYDNSYFLDKSKPAISLTLPKSQKEFYSEKLFSFFFGLLSEGDLRTIQCRQLGIDEKDHFTRLLKTGTDTIGAIRIQEVEDGQMS